MNLSQLAVIIASMTCTAGALAAPRYTITDLGPYISYPGMRSLNDSGQTTGQFFTADGIEHASLADSEGNITDLGTLGGNYSEGRDINSSGQVTGKSYLADGGVHAFVTDSEGNMFDLGSLGADTLCSNCYSFTKEASEGLAINDSGQVTGSAHTASGYFHAFVTDTEGNMIDLGALGDSFSAGWAINESGQVTGFSKLANSGENHAFVTDTEGNMIDLGTLGGGSSVGRAINDSGQVTGDSDTPAGGREHAFVTDRAGNMIDLGTLGGPSSTGTAINNSGQVTGLADTASGRKHAFVTDTEGNMIDLGTLGGSFSTSTAINDSGQVTGYSHLSNLSVHAFVTDSEGNMFDLNELFDNSSNYWVLLRRADDISNSGYITGYGNANGESRAFLLTPIEPIPVITVEPIVTSINETTAVVSWETDIPATSVVNYGLTGEVDKNVSSESLITKHSVVLTGLTNSTLYYLKVTSADGDGNVSEISRTITFTTLADTTTPDSPELSVWINSLKVLLTWSPVNDASGYKLYYAPYPYTGPESISFIDVDNAEDFSIELWEGAAYYVAISAYNSAGESGYSNIEQFSLK